MYVLNPFPALLRLRDSLCSTDFFFTVTVQQFEWAELSAESTQISLKAQQAGPSDPCPEPAVRRLACLPAALV